MIIDSLKPIAIITLLFILTFSCSRPLESDAVGLIVGKPVKEQEFFAWLPESKFNALPDSVKSVQVRTFLDSLVIDHEINRVRLWEERPVFLKIEAWRRYDLRSRLYQMEVVEHLITLDRLELLADEVRIERDLSGILISFQGSRTSNAVHDKQSAEALAWEIYRRARSEDFASLARRYSDLPNAEKSGGRIGWYSRLGLPEEIAEKVWPLRVGEVTQPFENGSGFHIVKVNDQRRINDPTVPADPNALRPVALRIWADELREAGENYQARLLRDHQFQLDTAGVEELFNINRDKVNKAANIGLIRSGMIADVTQDIFLGTYNGTKMDKSWLREHLAILEQQRSQSVESLDVMMGMVTNMVSRDLLYRKAIQLGLNQKSDHLNRVEKYRSFVCRAHFLNIHVKEAVKPTEPELMAFYDQFKRERYLTEEQVRTKEIMVSDSALSQKIYREIAQGAHFDSLAQKYGDEGKTESIGPSFGRNERGVVGEVAFRMQPGEINPPVEMDNRYYIIKLTERIPAQIRFFNEVRAQVEAEYREVQERRLRDELLERLNRKYKVRINPEFLN